MFLKNGLEKAYVYVFLNEMNIGVNCRESPPYANFSWIFLVNFSRKKMSFFQAYVGNFEKFSNEFEQTWKFFSTIR